MDQSIAFRSVVDLMEKLNSDSDCRSFLKTLLWKQQTPLGCPRCGNMTTYVFKDDKTYKCAGCRKKFNVLTGTIFENTKLPLNKWIACIWMSTSYKRGISSYQVARNIGVTQKTAWFMMQRIRVLFNKLKPESLEGTCTADETYIGGKQKNKHKDKKVKGQQGRGSSEKINVVGVMQIGGKVVTEVVTDVSRATLIPLVKRYVRTGSTVLTDEWRGYNGLNRTYTHDICDHSKKQYVSQSGATTNPIENYWSHVKRTVIGTYYHLSKKHITRYLSEFDFKFNYRDLKDNDKFRLVLANADNSRLKYNQLIQKP
jgi:transposase-like protein